MCPKTCCVIFRSLPNNQQQHAAAAQWRTGCNEVDSAVHMWLWDSIMGQNLLSSAQLLLKTRHKNFLHLNEMHNVLYCINTLRVRYVCLCVGDLNPGLTVTFVSPLQYVYPVVSWLAHIRPVKSSVTVQSGFWHQLSEMGKIPSQLFSIHPNPSLLLEAVWFWRHTGDSTRIRFRSF